VTTTFDKSAFDTPGQGRGLLDVFKYRYLLRLLISKGSSLRYRNSVLGWLWSYVRPTVQFLIYYLVVGQILGVHRNVEAFPIYLFSGLVVVNLFNEAIGATTRSIVDNKALVRKIYLPRELFPISAVIGSFIHFLPQLAVLLIVCFLFGWVPTFASVGLMIAGLVMVATFVLGVGLLFSAINVRFRDAQNFIEIIRTIATWSSPIMYTWVMVHDRTEHFSWIFRAYMSNPITVAVEMFHEGFWSPIVPQDKQLGWPPGFEWNIGAAILIIIVVTLVGQLVFRRFERTFAQDL
jgi:ABC-2 type transport system permease protein